jgi:coenzyme Q-binding protein COQ10
LRATAPLRRATRDTSPAGGGGATGFITLPAHSESRILPYTADLMYAIVADVERYPDFVPWCAGLRVLKRERQGGREVMIAETLIGYRSLRERYTSRVLLDPVARTIDVTQTDGPFRQLENHWRFTPEGANCRVDFSILFEFRSRMLGMVAATVLGPVMSRMTDAFESRARELAKR